MRTNAKIRECFAEIAAQSVKFSNTPNPDTAYLRRMNRVYGKTLTEEEQIFVLHLLLEMLHYRNVMIDPSTLTEISNIQLKKYIFFFLMFCAGAVLLSVLFKSNTSVMSVVDMLGGLMKMLSI